MSSEYNFDEVDQMVWNINNQTSGKEKFLPAIRRMVLDQSSDALVAVGDRVGAERLRAAPIDHAGGLARFKAYQGVCIASYNDAGTVHKVRRWIASALSWMDSDQWATEVLQNPLKGLSFSRAALAAAGVPVEGKANERAAIEAAHKMAFGAMTPREVLKQALRRKQAQATNEWDAQQAARRLAELEAEEKGSAIEQR